MRSGGAAPPIQPTSEPIDQPIVDGRTPPTASPRSPSPPRRAAPTRARALAGRYDGSSWLDTVECYDARLGEWCAHPPPPPRTKWTRRVPHPVLIGHAASLTPYTRLPREARASLSDTHPPPPCEAHASRPHAPSSRTRPSHASLTRARPAPARAPRPSHTHMRRNANPPTTRPQACRDADAVPPPPSLRTKWTRRVPHPVLIGHAVCLVLKACRDADAVQALWARQRRLRRPNLRRRRVRARARARAPRAWARAVRCPPRPGSGAEGDYSRVSGRQKSRRGGGVRWSLRPALERVPGLR